MKNSNYDKCVELAQKRYSDGIDALMTALYNFKNPLPHLSEYHSKKSRMMVDFIEVLLDQNYPRYMWQKVFEDMFIKQKH